METNTQYNDFKGTVSADISDALRDGGLSDLERIGRYFNLNTERFKIVGLSFYGTEDFSIFLICVDKDKSTKNKEHIVKMSYDLKNKEDVLDILFKRLHIVLYNKYDEKYPSLKNDTEANFSDFHQTE